MSDEREQPMNGQVKAGELMLQIGILDPVSVRPAPSWLLSPKRHGLFVVYYGPTSGGSAVLRAVIAALLRVVGVVGTEVITLADSPAVMIREAFRGAWPVAPREAMAALQTGLHFLDGPSVHAAGRLNGVHWIFR